MRYAGEKRGLICGIPEGATETGQVDVEATMAEGFGAERDEAQAVLQLLDEAPAKLDPMTTVRTLHPDQSLRAIALPDDVGHPPSQSRRRGAAQRQTVAVTACPA